MANRRDILDEVEEALRKRIDDGEAHFVLRFGHSHEYSGLLAAIETVRGLRSGDN